LLFLAPIQAGWKVTSSESDKAAAGPVERRHIAVSDTSGDAATLDLALFSPKAVNVRVVDNPNGDDLAAAMRKLRGLAGVNGGYFDPENAPVGLLISDGKLIAPFRKARLLSGVMVANKGRLDLLRAAEYSPKKSSAAALQCGPFLVDGGVPVGSLNNTRPARRTFIVTTGTDRVALGSCSSVTLAQLGEILATPRLLTDLKVQRALNLDGGSSSAFWFAGEGAPYSIAEYKIVRNFVVITPK
jgi:exopolysaccharide biosynthesis protein